MDTQSGKMFVTVEKRTKSRDIRPEGTYLTEPWARQGEFHEPCRCPGYKSTGFDESQRDGPNPKHIFHPIPNRVGYKVRGIHPGITFAGDVPAGSEPMIGAPLSPIRAATSWLMAIFLLHPGLRQCSLRSH